MRVFAIAEAVEDAHDRLGDVEEIAGGRELVEQVARPAHSRRAATDGDPEPELGTAVRPAHAGLETDVVNRSERVVLGTPFEGDLELARQRRR